MYNVFLKDIISRLKKNFSTTFNFKPEVNHIEKKLC